MGTTFQTTHGIVNEAAPETLAQDQQLLTAAQRGLSATQNSALERSTGGSTAAWLNEQTISAIQGTQQQFQEQFQRDQGYVGNNSQNVGYVLEDGAKYITSRMTPLVNMTPRVAMPGIDTVNYRTVLDLFNGNGPTPSSGVLDQGGTPAKVTYNWKSLSYTAKMMAVSDAVTFETQIYGRSFQGDPLALASAKLIPALKQIQEYNYINWAQKLWAPAPAYNLSTAATGGTIAAATNWILLTAVNAQGETLAYSATASSIVTTGATSTVTFNIQRVPGATKYNVYVGTGTTQPANSAMWLQSAASQFGGANALNDVAGFSKGYITVTATVAWATSGTAYSTQVTAGNTAYQVALSTYAGNTTSPLSFDGALSLIYLNAGAVGAFGTQGETPLIVQPAASNGALALSDIDTLHQNMYLNGQADPDYMFVSVVDHKKVSQLVSQGTNARIMLNADNADAQKNLVAGYRASAYINQTTGKVIPIVMLPYLTQGTIMFGSFELPTTLQGIDLQPFRVGYNRDMWSQVYAPDQSHPTVTLVSAFTNECIINQYLAGWAAISGISLS
jgi:hypothetical protein